MKIMRREKNQYNSGRDEKTFEYFVHARLKSL